VCWSANGAFTTHPSNVAVSTNDRAVFTCATDPKSSDPVLIGWSHIAAGSASLPPPFVRFCVVSDAQKPFYHTESAAGVCKLIVNSTQLTNAGTYLCQDGQGPFSTAELVVLGNYIIALLYTDLIIACVVLSIWHKVFTNHKYSKVHFYRATLLAWYMQSSCVRLSVRHKPVLYRNH